jgi:hypothetical protein
MRILRINLIHFYTFSLGFFTFQMNAQDQNINIIQDPKFEQLLNEKRKINNAIAVNELYKIQVFSGNSEKAKTTLNECKRDFENLDATIIFNTPNYKVWVGNFKTRIDAERNLIEVRKNYPNALIIKPQK